MRYEFVVFSAGALINNICLGDKYCIVLVHIIWYCKCEREEVRWKEESE